MDLTSLINKAEDAASDAADYASSNDDWTTGQVGLIAGAAAIFGGIVGFFMNSPDDDKKRRRRR